MWTRQQGLLWSGVALFGLTWSYAHCSVETGSPLDKTLSNQFDVISLGEAVPADALTALIPEGADSSEGAATTDDWEAADVLDVLETSDFTAVDEDSPVSALDAESVAAADDPDGVAFLSAPSSSENSVELLAAPPEDVVHAAPALVAKPVSLSTTAVEVSAETVVGPSCAAPGTASTAPATSVPAVAGIPAQAVSLSSTPSSVAPPMGMPQVAQFQPAPWQYAQQNRTQNWSAPNVAVGNRSRFSMSNMPEFEFMEGGSGSFNQASLSNAGSNVASNRFVRAGTQAAREMGLTNPVRTTMMMTVPYFPMLEFGAKTTIGLFR